MIKNIIQFFDKLEDHLRSYLSHHPIIYALVGGFGVVLFWREVWHMADDISLDSVSSTFVGAVILLVSGVFVSVFIGNRLIITGLKGEKKLAERTEEELKTEAEELTSIEKKIGKIESELSHIEKSIENK